jgi:hypothetical protein
MSHATNKIVEDIAELPLFSTAVYRQPAPKVLIINESDADTVLFRSTLETISGGGVRFGHRRRF